MTGILTNGSMGIIHSNLFLSLQQHLASTLTFLKMPMNFISSNYFLLMTFLNIYLMKQWWFWYAHFFQVNKDKTIFWLQKMAFHQVEWNHSWPWYSTLASWKKIYWKVTGVPTVFWLHHSLELCQDVKKRLL